MLPSTTALLSSLRSRRRRSAAAPLLTTTTMAAEIALMATQKTAVVTMTESPAWASLRRHQQQQQQQQLRQDHPIDLLCRSFSQRHEDDERDAGGTAIPVTRSTCVEFGLAWVPRGPATYATMMTTMVAAEVWATTAPTIAAAATNLPDDLGGRRDDDSGSTTANFHSRQNVVRKEEAGLLVLLMHFAANQVQYELLRVSSSQHHHCDGDGDEEPRTGGGRTCPSKVVMTAGRSVREYVDAALREATWSRGDGGEMECMRYSACLRLRVSLVPSSSSGPASAPSIRTQLPKRRSGGTDADGASLPPPRALWSLDDSVSSTSHHRRLGRRPSVVEVVVPVPTGQCGSRTLRLARKILELPHNVRAMTRLQGLVSDGEVKKENVGGDEGVRGRFGPPTPRTEPIRNDDDDRALLPSRPESRNGRTPLGSARPAAHTRESKPRARPIQKRRCSAWGSDDPSDKENVNSTGWGTGQHFNDP